MSRRNLRTSQLISLSTSLSATSIVHTHFGQLQAACVHVVPSTEMFSCPAACFLYILATGWRHLSKSWAECIAMRMQYVHLWVDSEGETHIKDAKMKGFELKKYAADPQFVKDDIETPTKVVFTELSPGIEQDFHPCPEVQFVACLAGAW